MLIDPDIDIDRYRHIDIDIDKDRYILFQSQFDIFLLWKITLSCDLDG